MQCVSFLTLSSMYCDEITKRVYKKIEYQQNCIISNSINWTSKKRKVFYEFRFVSTIFLAEKQIEFPLNRCNYRCHCHLHFISFFHFLAVAIELRGVDERSTYYISSTNHYYRGALIWKQHFSLFAVTSKKKSTRK